MIQKWFFLCIFVYFFLILNIFEMKDTSGRNCTAIWSFFSQASLKKIVHSRCVDLRISFFFFLFSFLLFRLVTNADLRPVILSEFHELDDSLPESIQQEAKISALWNVNPRKWKENTRQLWLTIPASPLDVLKTIQRYKFIFVINTRLIKLSCFFFLHFRRDRIDERNCYFLPFLFSFLCFPFVEIMRILNLKRFREIFRNL